MRVPSPFNLKEILIGAHTSSAGGVHNALYFGEELGANAIQLFTANQRQWKQGLIKEEEIKSWNKALSETKIEFTMSHDSYLINLGSPVEEILHKSREAFKLELLRCIQLGIPYLNFHPGSATESSEEKALQTIVKSLKLLEKEMQKGSTELLLETTAGQGTSVGYKFEHLDYIIGEVKDKIPIGVTIDTCHIFAAGYDIRGAEAWEKTLDEFDKIVGLKFLKAFHVNDSINELGSRVDRHENLGKGKIGLECFKFMMSNKRTKFIPKILETPDGDRYWKKEINLLRSYAHKN